MTDFILDTNVFYNIGDGSLGVADVKALGGNLFYSPISIIEITSKVNEGRLAQCKGAAQAILDSGASQLLGPEQALTLMFGNKLKRATSDWSQVAKAIAGALSDRELRHAVKDLKDQVVRAVDYKLGNKVKISTGEDWQRKMLKLMRDKIPRFGSWYDPDPVKRKGNKPTIRGKPRKQILKEFASDQWFTSVLVACQQRSFFEAELPGDFVPTKEFAARLHAAMGEIECYCAMYTQYLIELLTTGMMPQANDGLDLEFFIHATDDDHVIVTSETRWVTIAEKAGYGQRARKPK